MEKFEEEDEDKDGQVTWPEYLNKVFGFNQEDLDDLQKTVKDSTEMSDEVKEAENTIKVSCWRWRERHTGMDVGRLPCAEVLT